MTVNVYAPPPNYTDDYVQIGWNYASTTVVGGLTYTFAHVNYTFAGEQVINLPNNSGRLKQIGYGTSWSYTVIAVYTRSGSANYNVTETGGGTTPAPPNAGPGTPVLSGSDGGSGYAFLSWTAASGAASYVLSGPSDVVVSGTSYSYYIGYSVTQTFSVLAKNSSGVSGNTSNTVSVTTGAASGGGGGTPPPAAPSAATALTVTPSGTGFLLSWVGSSASGYQVQRNGTAIGTTAGSGYTDTTPGTFPVTYQVVAYNTNAGGTTYGPASNSVTIGVGDSAGILAC